MQKHSSRHTIPHTSHERLKFELQRHTPDERVVDFEEDQNGDVNGLGGAYHGMGRSNGDTNAQIYHEKLVERYGFINGRYNNYG
jgi:hypothetical protein